ncbi:furin (paired basic amino acid cleaving enzyme) b isoform X2 [Hypomesus transpacificus]|uniref:furin (paired basic amino acid cleaving enzyme) b isoform X2 n=1 Tax=Hypomesus transpacificus TaxID=137520 RepID=UPI001F07675A|nr:furin (paired basic amino acid cleaving enzyme) b isoform X2 [Hypomesus transpacificus]
MEAQLVLLQLGAALVLLTTVPQTNAAGQVYTNTWAVRIQGGPEQADLVARKHGFVNHGNVFGDYYHFRHHSVAKRSLSGHSRTHALLQEEPQVQWTEQQVAKPRKKRDIYEAPSDPKFSEQWYLSSPSHQDLNTREAWAQGYTGRGVVVTILDDGIEKDHPDLAPNYDPDASYDVNDGDSDPQPRYTQRNENRHGTRCAGEVAASANNGVCGVGVAYNARIGGVRMLDGEVTDVVEAHSLSMNSQHVHVYSASWGPEDDGKTVDGPAKLAKEAFLRGVTEGRGGLGSIFVWASGNGGRERDSCNCDGYTNSIYTLSISSTTQYGNVPWYSEACSSTLATTYSSGNPGEKQIVTTDLRQKCTDSHTGTSASAPLAAGIIALALEANANLTWRDMQHLVVRTSQPAHLSADDWKTNGMGRRGMLTQFSLILYGTGSSAISPSSPDFPRPSNNSCKTFDAQQICIECSPGFSLFLQGCVKMCPPGFTSGPQLLNLSLETWVDLSSVQACLPCNAACLTCAGPGPSDCLSCPPHSHLVLSSCPHQNQVQRKSPISRLLPAEDSHPAGESSAGGGGGGEAQAPGPGPSPSSSPVPTKVAVLSCAFILAAFGGLFLLLQLRSGGAPWAWRSRLRAAEGGGFRLGSGLGRGWERKTRVCYKGIPTVWGDEDMARPSEESDSEEPDSHSERTAFIRTQSSL